MTNKIVLIDAENLGCNTSVIKRCLSEYNKVFIIFSHLLAKLDFNTIADFSSDIKNERLNIIKMDKIGKNSADFGLAFIAGQLSSTLEKGSTIEIRSQDLMFNNIISMLNKCGINAQQVLRHPTKIVNKVPEVLDSEIEISDSGSNNQIPIDSIGEDELLEMNCTLSEKIDLYDLNSPEQFVIEDIFDLNIPSQPINNDILNDFKDVSDETCEDEHVIQQISQFNSENKISFSNKSRRVLGYLINRIKNDKFKRGVLKSTCDNFGTEKDIAKIIFNCLYIYGMFTHKVKSRSYQSIMTHLSTTNGLSKHFATVFINYLCTCNLIKQMSGQITRMTNFLPILKALEDVKSHTSLLKE